LLKSVHITLLEDIQCLSIAFVGGTEKFNKFP